MVYVLKIKYDGNLRRLTLKKNKIDSGAFTFAHLVKEIRELFELPAAAPLAFTYTDVDNDNVTIGGDHDLKDALIEQSLNPLRIQVAMSKVKYDEQAQKAKDTHNAIPLDIKRMLHQHAFDSGLECMKLACQSYQALVEGIMSAANKSYQPLVEGVVSAAQNGLLEFYLQGVAAQLTFAAENGVATAIAAAPEPGPNAVRDKAKESWLPCEDCGRKSDPKLRCVDLCQSCYENQGKRKKYTKVDGSRVASKRKHAMAILASYSISNFVKSASSFTSYEEEALRIHIKETNNVFNIFPKHANIQTDPDLERLKLETFDRERVLLFTPDANKGLDDVQVRFLMKLKCVLESISREGEDPAFDLYVRAMVDTFLGQCKLHDPLDLRILPSMLYMDAGKRSFATWSHAGSTKEGRRGSRLIWVLQESKDKSDSRYKNGEIQLISALIGACQRSCEQFTNKILPQVIYGINIKGEEVSIFRAEFTEGYILSLSRGLPNEKLKVRKYPRGAGLKLSNPESRIQVLSLMTKLRKYALSISLDMLDQAEQEESDDCDEEQEESDDSDEEEEESDEEEEEESDDEE